MPQETEVNFKVDDFLPSDNSHPDDDMGDVDFGNDITTEEDEVEETEVEETEVEEVEEVEEESEEEESEEEEEAEAEEEVVAEEPKKHMIPKRRLDDVVAKQRKAEQEASELRKEMASMRAEAAAKPTIDIRALSKLRSEAVLDGDLDKAAEIDEQMHAPSQQQVAEPIDMGELEARVEAKMELKTTLADVFENYPELDTESDSFDEELNSEALVFQSAYLSQGHSPAEAVRRAADAAIRVMRPELMWPEAAAPVAKAKARKTNVKGNVDASNAQPPKLSQGSTGGKGDVGAININSLSNDEFDALPEATRARLRGDTL